MNTTDTALNRVEAVLQGSETGLFVHQIARNAHATEKEAKASIKSLHAMGQIEMIPTPGRWGPRYAWLAAKPVAAEPPATREDDPVSGVQATITGNGSGEVLSEIPMLDGSPEEAIVKAFAESADGPPNSFQKAFTRLFDQIENPRYLVLVPKRNPRIVKSRKRAEALAMAAVRAGAPSAEVCMLESVGKARREAVFQELGT